MFKNTLIQIFLLMLGEKKQHFNIFYAMLMHCAKINK